MVDNFNCWFVKVAKKFEWWSKWQIILSCGVSKWEVAVKVVKNSNWWCVKMGSGSQNGKYFSVMVGTNGK